MRMSLDLTNVDEKEFEVNSKSMFVDAIDVIDNNDDVLDFYIDCLYDDDIYIDPFDVGEVTFEPINNQEFKINLFDDKDNIIRMIYRTYESVMGITIRFNTNVCCECGCDC